VSRGNGAVGAEVLVAVAAGDLVVALHAGHHEQLLEQLRRLRQRVPGTGGQARRNDEVAGALGGAAGHRGGLDLDEVASLEHPAGGGAHLGSQPDRAGRGRAAQVQVAVLEPGLFADGDPFVDLERQRRGRVQHLEFADRDLDLAGGQVGVGVALGTRLDDADHLDAVLVAQFVGTRRGQHLVANDDLNHTGGVAQVDEGDTAMVSPLADPAGESDLGADVGGAQGACFVGAQHDDVPFSAPHRRCGRVRSIL
jgi:hypothetical protein